MTIKRSTISRRRALAGAAGVGVGVPLLAACGDDTAGGGTASDPASSPSSSEPNPQAQSKPSATRTAEQPPPADGIATSEVPVGGGIIQDDVVLTQPSEGEFRAFTAVCTHQQCLVGDVSDGTINCPCHGSRFSIEDGSVTAGPAPTSLAEVDITVDRGRIVVG